MGKQKKSRVEFACLQTFEGINDVYYLTIPYDKKNRVIPSSVECAYNSVYFSTAQAVDTLRSL